MEAWDRRRKAPSKACGLILLENTAREPMQNTGGSQTYQLRQLRELGSYPTTPISHPMGSVRKGSSWKSLCVSPVGASASAWERPQSQGHVTRPQTQLQHVLQGASPKVQQPPGWMQPEGVFYGPTQSLFFIKQWKALPPNWNFFILLKNLIDLI